MCDSAEWIRNLWFSQSQCSKYGDAWPLRSGYFMHVLNQFVWLYSSTAGVKVGDVHQSIHSDLYAHKSRIPMIHGMNINIHKHP